MKFKIRNSIIETPEKRNVQLAFEFRISSFEFPSLIPNL